jgi:hypothetical protein
MYALHAVFVYLLAAIARLLRETAQCFFSHTKMLTLVVIHELLAVGLQVKHGRLAMLSILGLVLQELITGQSLMLQMQSYGFNAFR